MDYILYIKEMIENFILNLSEQALFIKHYGSEEINKTDFLKLFPRTNSSTCFYHEYKMDTMYEAYEPFLDWIRLSYFTFYKDTMSVDTFLENGQVYSLHREPFSTYITTGRCQRTEDVMPIEVNFERNNIFSDIINIFRYIAAEHHLILVISAFHLAPFSSVTMLLELIKQKIPEIHFIIVYNDTYYIRSYIHNAWNNLITYVKDHNMLFEWGKFSNDIVMHSVDEFVFEPKDFKRNIVRLWNMYHTFAFEDVQYYISDIYNKIEHNRQILTEWESYEILSLYTLINLCMDDNEAAIMTCKSISSLSIYNTDWKIAYMYHFLSIKTQFSSGHMDIIRSSYLNCMTIARQVGDEFLQFKAELLYCMAQFGGWKDLFLCDFRIPVPEELLEQAKKYGFLNHLAYLYAMGFENDEKSVTAIATGQKNSVYFAKGIQLAKELGNNDFLMSAYMKNIIIYSDAGYHEYVYQMHKKRIETVDSNDLVLKAHMYLGIGYNCIILENYKKANDYFLMALTHLLDQNKADDCMDALYNICMNYFVIEDYETVIPCIEVLLKMLHALGYQNVMVCNTAKLYGMLAISHFNLQDYYNAYHYLGLMDIHMNHFHDTDENVDYKYWEEELFLYHYIRAILYEYENKLDACQKELDRAYYFLWLLPGTIFYTYSLYTVAQSNLYEKTGQINNRQQLLDTAITYYKKQGFMFCASKLIALQEKKPFQKFVLEFNEAELQFDRLLNLANYEGTQNKLKYREKDIAFLTIWQENLNRSATDIHTLIENAITIIQNSYNLSDVVMLKNEHGQQSILFNNSNVNLSPQRIQIFFDFFQRYKRGFLTNRTDKNFLQFMPIIEPFGKKRVITMLGIPISDGDTDYILLSHVNASRNFTGNRVLLTEGSLVTLKFACSQLVDAMNQINSNLTIRLMNEKLEKVSMTDYLTGIYNRHGFSYIIENKLQYNNNTNLILYIDLDNFKYYNDTFGHDTGDFVLVKCTEIFTNLVGDSGYTIRYGGDEFVIVLPDKDEMYGQAIAAKIFEQIADGMQGLLEQRLQRPIQIPPDKKLSCSIGITEYTGSSEQDIEQALNNADQALYFIKRNSKGHAMTWSKLKDFKI